MRIFALSILCLLSIAAYSLRKTNHAAPPEPTCAPATGCGQTADLLLQTADGGHTWQDISQGLPEKLMAKTVLTRDGAIYLGDREGGRLYYSADPAKNAWQQESVGRILPDDDLLFQAPNIIGLFPGRSGPYASVFQEGFFQKDPASNYWKPMHGSLPEKTVHAVLENPDASLLVGGPKGLFKTADGGKTWKSVFPDCWVYDLVASNGAIVASVNGGLLRSTDGGEHWDWTLSDKGGIYSIRLLPGNLPLSPDQIAAIRVAGPTQCGGAIALRTSADGGNTWLTLTEALSKEENIYDLAQAGNYLFCSHTSGLSRSADGGKTWELLRPAPGEMQYYKLAVSGETLFVVKAAGGC